jgi:hypothetical protein
VPLSVPGLSWSNLDGYYQMNKATDILNGNVMKSLTPIQGRLINIGTQQPETAPLPTQLQIMHGRPLAHGQMEACGIYQYISY